jgi:cell wall-associated NlpC family hydrolase
VFAGEPLRISHASRSGEWLFVATAYAKGWVPADAVAEVPERLVKRWRDAQWAAFTRDGVALHDEKGRFLYRGRIGMIAPIVQTWPDGFEIETVVSDGRGGVRTKRVKVAFDAIDTFPLAWTRPHVIQIADGLLPTPYGWGGLFGWRDCSATVRDFFAPFGVWLPRNSAAQAAFGRVVDVRGKTPAQKRRALKRRGLPFATLVNLPGHVMLYLGTWQGEPVVMHTVWGVKTRTAYGEPGRWIVGKTVVSTLQLGQELPSADANASLWAKMRGFTVVEGAGPAD